VKRKVAIDQNDLITKQKYPPPPQKSQDQQLQKSRVQFPPAECNFTYGVCFLHTQE
jgi:hypothetical protein